jgi:hypothetical protein
MEREWGKDVQQTESPRIASYSALQRGILNERRYAEWCRWAADRLEKDKGSARQAVAPARVRRARI